MKLSDFATLDLLRQNHPAWRMLRSDPAPPVASFLNRTFIVPNLRVMPQADLTERLEDQLFDVREAASRRFHDDRQNRRRY